MAKLFTQPAVMIVVTNIKCEGRKRLKELKYSCFSSHFKVLYHLPAFALLSPQVFHKFFKAAYRVGAVLCLGQRQHGERHVKMVDQIEDMDNLKDNSLMI